MINKCRTKGFVFKKIDKSDCDGVFSIYTKDYGRLEVLARAVRKINSKLRAGIEVFSFSNIEFVQGRKGKTLTDAVVIDKNNRILEDFNLAVKISDLLEKYIKGEEKDKEVYELIENVFKKLKNAKNKEFLYYYFVFNFLAHQGYKIYTQNCVVCKNCLGKEDAYFSKNDSGIICQKCSIGGQVYLMNQDVLKILRLIFNKDIDTVSILKMEDNSKKILNDFSGHLINAFCPS